MRGRFVGREPELETLGALVAVAGRRGGVQAGIVVGVPGSGKSRLLAEVVARAASPVLRITGYEPEQTVPLTATRDLLRRLSRVPGEGARLEAVAFGEQLWGRSEAPLRLFEAAYRCVRESSPALLVIDDLQWIDEVSAALVTYLVRAAQADGTPLALVAGGRPSGRIGAVRDSLAGILPAPALHELELGPLGDADGIALVRHLAPGTSIARARRTWERAGGSPFWIEALAVDAEAAEASLSRRFSRLGDDGGALLQALAVVGRPAQEAELGAALLWPPERTASAIGELRARGLALERSGAVEVAHDLVREAAAAQLPARAARPLHARLSSHLRAAAGDDVQLLREALDHAVAGGVATLGLALRIARAPQRRLIGTAGVRELARIAQDAARGDPTRAELELALAELSTELGDRTLELERWTAVADHGEPLARARALHAASKASYRLGLRDEAAGFIARARAIGATDPAIEIALDAQESAILRWLAHRLPEARRLTRRALRAAEEALAAAQARRKPLDPRMRAAAIEAFQAGYDLALQEGYEAEQAVIADRLVDLADDELEEVEARLLLASACRRSGRMEDAERLAREALGLAAHHIYPAVMVTAGHHLARALYSLGRLEEAEQVAGEAERLSSRIGETGRFLSEIRSLRPGIAVGRGDWRAGIDRLRADLEREPDPHYQLGIHQEIATWLARLAGPPAIAEVRARIESARGCLAAVGCPRCGRELALRGAEALARVGDVDAARAAMAEAPLGEARRSYEGRLFLGQAIGALRGASGPPPKAASTLARLGERLAGAGYRREALWADIDRAAALAAFDRNGAVEVYRSVAERAASGGMLTDLQLARHRLRQLGARAAPPRPAATLLGLSRRELEVARLAAAGASNPEIAATLFLSRKTVERHMSAALSKVGARNRTELASRLARLEPPAAEGRADAAPADARPTGDGQEMRELPDTGGRPST